MTEQPADDDMIAVADLPEPLRLYVKRDELAAGRISLELLRHRQKGAEGRVLAHARERGEQLFAADRTGNERIATTAATVEIDTTGGRAARANRYRAGVS